MLAAPFAPPPPPPPPPPTTPPPPPTPGLCSRRRPTAAGRSSAGRDPAPPGRSDRAHPSLASSPSWLRVNLTGYSSSGISTQADVFTVISAHIVGMYALVLLIGELATARPSQSASPALVMLPRAAARLVESVSGRRGPLPARTAGSLYVAAAADSSRMPTGRAGKLVGFVDLLGPAGGRPRPGVGRAYSEIEVAAVAIGATAIVSVRLVDHVLAPIAALFNPELRRSISRLLHPRRVRPPPSFREMKTYTPSRARSRDVRRRRRGADARATSTRIARRYAAKGSRSTRRTRHRLLRVVVNAETTT